MNGDQCFLIPPLSPSVPLERKCSADGGGDRAFSNDETDLLTLMEEFPDVRREEIEEIYARCSNNIALAVDMLKEMQLCASMAVSSQNSQRDRLHTAQAAVKEPKGRFSGSVSLFMHYHVSSELPMRRRGVSAAFCVPRDCLAPSAIEVMCPEVAMPENVAQSATGDVVAVPRSAVAAGEGQFVFLLVYKEHYYEKASLETLERCLRRLRALVLETQVEALAVPAIGSGTDDVEQLVVDRLVDDIFKDTSLRMTTYSPPTQV